MAPHTLSRGWTVVLRRYWRTDHTSPCAEISNLNQCARVLYRYLRANMFRRGVVKRTENCQMESFLWDTARPRADFSCGAVGQGRLITARP